MSKNKVAIRYFVLDAHGKIHRAAQRTFEAVWQGDRSVLELGVALGDWLPVVTVLLDKDLHPAYLHVLRIPVEKGFITEDGRMHAVHAFLAAPYEWRRQAQFDRIAKARGRKHASKMVPKPDPRVAATLEGWPEDVTEQLAAVLDVPASGLPTVGIGGPLTIARQMGMTIKSYLLDAANRLFCHKCGKAARPKRNEQHWPPLCPACAGKGKARS